LDSPTRVDCDYRSVPNVQVRVNSIDKQQGILRQPSPAVRVRSSPREEIPSRIQVEITTLTSDEPQVICHQLIGNYQFPKALVDVIVLNNGTRVRHAVRRTQLVEVVVTRGGSSLRDEIAIAGWFG